MPWAAPGGWCDGLVRLIEGQGGSVRCNAEVARDHRRRTARRAACGSPRARRIAADVVVSNADSAWTYRHLLPAQRARAGPTGGIERARYSMSLFVWYFGTRRRYQDVPHHTILLGPALQASCSTDIFDRKVLADDFSLYLHRPTATDPSLAPPGCDAFYVLSPVPHLQSGTDWSVRGRGYRQAIAANSRSDRAARPGERDRHVRAC